MNIYLISSFYTRLTDKEIKTITDGIENIVTFNYDDVTLEDIMEECSYYSLLNEKKCVIVKGFKLNKEANNLLKYLEKPNELTKLILITSQIDKRNSLYKYIEKNGVVTIYEELKPNEVINKINTYIKEKNININLECIKLLLSYNLNNLDLVLNEIDKLSLITKNITKDIVLENASVIIEDNTFGLIDAIVDKNYLEINKLLDNYILNDGEIIPLISLLENQYRFIYLTFGNYSNDKIAELLKVHPYRIKLASEKKRKYTQKELEELLEKLFDLDYKLKTSQNNEYNLFKEFLIDIIK